MAKASATLALDLHSEGNPTFGWRCCTIRGNTMLPVPLPEAAIPSAIALFFFQYKPMTATAGMYRMPMPRPVHRPCARKVCQYVVARLVMKVPRRSSPTPGR